MPMIQLRMTCPLCNSENTVDMEEAELEAYDNGALIQEAFPNHSAGDRELVKTGICTPCWDRTLGEDS